MSEFITDHYPELKDLIKELDLNLDIKTSMMHMAVAIDFAYETTEDLYYQNVMKMIISILKADTP